MKKTLIALAAVAVSSAAMAQVTVSGAIAAGSSKDGTARSVVSMEVAELRFAASEDLGNGLKAAGFFVIENMNRRGRTDATTTDAGTTATTDSFVTNGATNADSGLSLSGGFGTVAMSNTRSSNLAANGNVFGGSIAKGFYDTVDTRPNVQILSYESPAFNGIKVGIASARVGTSATTQAANITVLGATFSNGPLTLGVQQKNKNTAALSTDDKKTVNEAFVRYDAGVAVVGLGYGAALETGTGVVDSKDLTTYGVSIPLGQITLGVEGAKRGVAEFQTYGARYALSKRTVLHISAGKYQTTATNSKSQSRVRVSHSF